MSVISKSLRLAVEVRAENRCEYCHLPVRGQIATFPVDHVTPRILSGETAIENLALSCPRCNGIKWKHTQGKDIESDEAVSLFNPRMQKWTDHFAWSREHEGMLVGLTACGRATVTRLQMNAVEFVAIRQLLAELGIFDEVLTGATDRR